MERVNGILKHPVFVQELNRIEEFEKDRIFCRHGLGHLLDVARIGFIIVLEKGLSIPKHMIYGAALLHDIGRAKQYIENKPHNKAAVYIASEVLIDCGYTDQECKWILDAIVAHREIVMMDKGSLSYILYTADKRSRNCFTCLAKGQCIWPEKQKNSTIDW